MYWVMNFITACKYIPKKSVCLWFYFCLCGTVLDYFPSEGNYYGFLFVFSFCPFSSFPYTMLLSISWRVSPSETSPAEVSSSQREFFVLLVVGVSGSGILLGAWRHA